MELYLNGEQFPLNDYQIQLIQQIISTPVTPQIISQRDKIQKTNDIISPEDEIQTEYTFNTTDTFLHSKLGTKSERIKYIFGHKLVVMIIIILAIVWSILYKTHMNYLKQPVQIPNSLSS
eukprot:190193_1